MSSRRRGDTTLGQSGLRRAHPRWSALRSAALGQPNHVSHDAKQGPRVKQQVRVARIGQWAGTFLVLHTCSKIVRRFGVPDFAKIIVVVAYVSQRFV